MKKKYIWIEGVERRPTPLTKQEKEARIYKMANDMKIKIGGNDEDTTRDAVHANATAQNRY